MGKLNLRLVIAVAAFVIFDLAALAFSFTMTRQVANDAVGINLAGRQRMLSQRVTKASLLATNPLRSEAARLRDAQEAQQAYALLQSTLSAFALGGKATGGDGKPVHINKATGRAAQLVHDLQDTLRAWPTSPAPGADWGRFTQFMVERNLQILDAMNLLTSELEHQSVRAVGTLRIAQTIAFSLSLGNFLLILAEMFRVKRKAETDAVTDALTGLQNRAGLYTALAEAVAYAHQCKTHLGIMLIDLDGFKAVNDTFGHAAGDAVLREVARRLNAWKDAGWIVARLGGDEFAVVCPFAAPKRLEAAAADLTQVLSDIPGGTLTISASVGAASIDPDSDADSLLARADQAMYSTKSAGRAHRAIRSVPR